MMDATNYLTIPKLAERLSIQPASVRDWIKRGLIEEPPVLPVTGERAYSRDAADRIERWYHERCAHGGTRGPGATSRKARAQQWLATAS